MASENEDVIGTAEETLIKAPRRPFPWWGPFDSINAIGRLLLLWGLLFLSGLFIILMCLEGAGQSPYRSRAELLESEITPDIVLQLGGMLLSFVSGFGLLLRRRWGVLALKITIIVYLLNLLVRIIIPLAEVDFSHSIAFKTFIMLLPGIVGLALILLTVPFALWGFWKKPAVRYEFVRVPVSDLNRSLYETTKQFGSIAQLLGTGLVLSAYQTVLFYFVFQMSKDNKITAAYFITFTGLIIVGTLLAAGGFLYRKRSNKGRIILRATSMLGLLCVIALSVLGLILVIRFKSQSALSLPFQRFTVGLITAFFFIVFAYIFLEIFRYLSCPKAKAWCGKGEYSPPWENQLTL